MLNGASGAASIRSRVSAPLARAAREEARRRKSKKRFDHLLVGIVKGLADITVTLEDGARAPPAHVGRGELSPVAQPSPTKTLQQRTGTVHVPGPEGGRRVGYEGRVTRAVNHQVDRIAQAAPGGGGQSTAGPREVALDDLDRPRRNRTERGRHPRFRAHLRAGSRHDQHRATRRPEAADDLTSDEAGGTGDEDARRGHGVRTPSSIPRVSRTSTSRST